MELSICIVTWNSVKEIKGCLDAVFREIGDKNIEVIVVDNASKDDTVKFILENYKKVKLIANNKNLGFAKANNQCWQNSSGKYILFLNPDAILTAGSLERLYEFITTSPEKVAAVGPKIVDIGGNLQYSCRRFPNLWVGLFRNPIAEYFFQNNKYTRYYLMKDYDHSQVLSPDWLSGACLMVSSEALSKIKGFDERYFMYCEDLDLCERLKKNNYEIKYLPTATVIHLHGRSTSQAFERSTIEFSKSLYKYFVSGGTKKWYKVLIPIIVLGLILRAGLLILQHTIARCREQLLRAKLR